MRIGAHGKTIAPFPVRKQRAAKAALGNPHPVRQQRTPRNGGGLLSSLSAPRIKPLNQRQRYDVANRLPMRPAPKPKLKPRGRPIGGPAGIARLHPSRSHGGGFGGILHTAGHIAEGVPGGLVHLAEAGAKDVYHASGIPAAAEAGLHHYNRGQISPLPHVSEPQVRAEEQRRNRAASQLAEFATGYKEIQHFRQHPYLAALNIATIFPVARAPRAAFEGGRAIYEGERLAEAARVAQESYKARKGLVGPAVTAAHSLFPSERALARNAERQKLKGWLFDNFPRQEARAQLQVSDAIARQAAREGRAANPSAAYDTIRLHVLAQNETPGDLKVLYHETPHLPHNLPERLRIKGLHPRVYRMIKQGAPWRDWYKRAAGTMIREAARLGVTPEEMTAVTAIMSQSANPTFNLRKAIEAIREYKTTGQINPKRYLEGQAEKATQVLEGNFNWPGMKTNHYFGNMLQHVNPALHDQLGLHDAVTVDRHMAEMFMGKQKITDAQYERVRQTILRTAKQIGWDPAEVQAAAWVPYKAGRMAKTQELRALSGELNKAGAIPHELLVKPGMSKTDIAKIGKLRAKWIREQYDAGQRATNYTPQPLERYLPSAGQAYEPGEAMKYQRLHREHTFASSVAQVHSEAAITDSELHPLLSDAFQKLSADDKRVYNKLVNKAVDGQFEHIIGLNKIGFHEGPGIWRGVQTEGIASHLEIGSQQHLTQETRDKLDALAAAQGIAKHQNSVAWGRPMAAGHGEFQGIHWDPAGQDAAHLSSVMDTVAGEGNVGFVHAPDGGFYVIDFAGGNETAIRNLAGHQTPIGWEGSYVIHDAAKGAGDFGASYNEAIDKLSPDVRGRLLQKINDVRTQVDQLDHHFLHVPIPQLVDKEGAQALAEAGGHTFHGTSPMNAESVMADRTLRVGGSDPEAAWTTTDPEMANFYAEGTHQLTGPGSNVKRPGSIVAIPRHSIPGWKEGPFGVHGAPEDIHFQGKYDHLTLDELHAHKVQLESGYENLLNDLAKAEGRPGDFKRLTAYQNATAKKTLRRTGKRAPTVTEMMRLNAENKLLSVMAEHPDHPLVQRLEADLAEARAVNQEIYRRNDALFQKGDKNQLFESGQFKGAFAHDPQINKGLIYLTEHADVTTLTHELGHFLAHFGLQGDALAAIEKYIGKPFAKWSEAEHEKFAEILPAMIRNGTAPKNLRAEWRILGPAFREAAPTGNELTRIPEDVQAVMKRLLGQQEGARATAYYMLRNVAMSRSLGLASGSAGVARTDAEAEQHLQDVRAQLYAKGKGRTESEIPKVPRGGTTPETGGELGRYVREGLAGKVDTSGMSQYGHEAAVARAEGGVSSAAARTARKEEHRLARRARVGRAEEAQQASAAAGDTGFDRYVALSKELGGELPSDAWHNFQGDVRTHANDILNFIMDHPGLQLYEKKDASDAIMRGIEGFYAPTASQEHALRMVFGREQAGSIRDLIKERKIGRLLEELVSIPRAIKASFDFGWGLRQGIMFAAARPRMFARLYKEQFRYLKESNYEALNEWIKNQPNFPIYDAMGVDFSFVSPKGEMLEAAQHEDYFRSHIAEMIPGIRASDRLYTGAANLNRVVWSNFMIDQGARAGYDMADPKVLHSLGELINNGTGRGSLGKLKKAMPVLSATLFSPRLLASRLQFMNPIWYARLNPLARQEALRAARNFTLFIGGVLTLARQSGAQVTLDPTNSDFGKIRVGNTRVDTTAGFTQEFRLVAQLLTQHVTSSVTGRRENLSGGAFGLSSMDIIQRWLRNKTNPTASVIWDVLAKSNSIGQPITATGEAGQLLTPLVASDVYQAYKQHGNPLSGLATLPLSEAGIGTQTYGTPKATDSEALKKVVKDSKDAGLPEPPAPVKADVPWMNKLDQATYSGQSSIDKAAAAAKLFDQRYGTNYSTTLVPSLQTEGQAEKLYLLLRSKLAPNLQAWQSHVNSVTEAKKAQQPIQQQAPAEHKTSAPPLPTVNLEQASYKLPAKNESRQLASTSAPSGSTQYITHAATQRGLDPQAVLAVASQEGLGGGVGDGGTSFGPFQLHAGGALPAEVWAKGPQYAATWAWSPQGINYALDHMASVARGLKGQAAVNAIVTRFERPAQPGREVAGAMSAYGQPVRAGRTLGSAGTGGGGRIPLPPGVSAPTGGGVSGGYDLGASAEEGLAALAQGSYDPSTQLLHLFRSSASQPVKQSVGGIHFDLSGIGGSKTARGAVALAQHYLGVKYVYGGESPQGFDCSGLLQWIWAKQGIQIPRTTYDQWKVGQAVGKGGLRPGDAVFFRGSDSRGGLPGHVGIYIGHGRFIEAPHTGATVRVSRLAGYPGYMGARRFARRGGKRA